MRYRDFIFMMKLLLKGWKIWNYPQEGELEITNLDKIYLSQTELSVQVIGQGIAWLDMGLPDSLLEAGEFIGRG